MVKSCKRQELLKAAGIAAFLAFFFYRSPWAFLPMCGPAGLAVWWGRKKAARQKNRRLLEQFSECILSVSGSVRAGYAAENAFVESMKDMEMMYGGDAEILEELRQLKGGLFNNRPLDTLLLELGERTGLEEVGEFAQVFAIAKRNGGDLAEVIHMTVQDIQSRMQAEEEIRTVLASKQLEQRIMSVMPFLLVMYLQFTTPGYFDMFFGNVTGVLLMTVFLLWYVGACALSERILWRCM